MKLREDKSIAAGLQDARQLAAQLAMHACTAAIENSISKTTAELAAEERLAVKCESDVDLPKKNALKPTSVPAIQPACSLLRSQHGSEVN